MHRCPCDSLDGWVEFTDSQTILDCHLLDHITVDHITADFEDILLKCCRKKELLHSLLPIIATCLTTTLSFSQSSVILVVIGLKLATEVIDTIITLSNESRIKIISELISMFTTLINECNNIIQQCQHNHNDNYLVYDSCITIYEHILSFYERLNIIDWRIYESLLLISCYPAAIESNLPCRHRKDIIDRHTVNEDDPNELIKCRIHELRDDTRQIYRKGYIQNEIEFGLQLIDLLRNISVEPNDWRIFESILHSLSVFLNRLSTISSIIPSLLISRLHGMTIAHRAVVCSIVICFTSSAKYIERLDSEVLPFIMNCLGTYDTLDFEYGWFDLRVKQDNCCIVFLQSISLLENRDIDIESLIITLRSNLSSIKILFTVEIYLDRQEIYSSNLS